MSVYSEAEHYNIIQNKYEKNINKIYNSIKNLSI